MCCASRLVVVAIEDAPTTKVAQGSRSMGEVSQAHLLHFRVYLVFVGKLIGSAIPAREEEATASRQLQCGEIRSIQLLQDHQVLTIAQIRTRIAPRLSSRTLL